MQHRYNCYDGGMTGTGNMGWGPGGTSGHGGHHPGSAGPTPGGGGGGGQLSVVATVWGVSTNSQQSGPIAHNYPGSGSAHHSSAANMVQTNSYPGPQPTATPYCQPNGNPAMMGHKPAAYHPSPGPSPMPTGTGRATGYAG